MKQGMKLLIGIAAGLLVGTSVFGQAQITTRREKLKNFTSTITKVVMTGDTFLDEALKESVSSHWTLSPYEFCSLEEFESLKTNPNYYFLMVVKGQFRKETEPGISLLTLVKGGDEAKDGINSMFEVVSFPLSSTDEPSGREFTLLPAMLQIIQNHTSRLTDTEMKAYASLKVYNKNFPKVWNKRIYFAEEDLSPQIDEKVRKSLDEDIMIAGEDVVDNVFANATYNTVVSYVVAPAEPVDGSWCYKMLIGADNHELYFFKRHRITARNGKGFLESDIKELKGTRNNIPK